MNNHQPSIDTGATNTALAPTTSAAGAGPAVARVHATIRGDDRAASFAALTGTSGAASFAATTATGSSRGTTTATTATASTAAAATSRAEDDVVIATRNVEGAAERCHDEHHWTKGRTLSHKYLSLLSAHAAEGSTKFTARKTCPHTSVTRVLGMTRVFGTEMRTNSNAACAVHASAALVSSRPTTCSWRRARQLTVFQSTMSRSLGFVHWGSLTGVRSLALLVQLSCSSSFDGGACSTPVQS
jgi:hypothetical protein